MATSVDNELMLFSGTTGEKVKRATETGVALLTAGVLSAVPKGGYDPITDLVFYDDFILGGTSAPDIAEGWNSSGGTVTFPAAVANHPGVMNRDCTATPSTVAYMSTRSFQANGQFDPAMMFDMTWIIKLTVNDANTLVKLGFSVNWANNPFTDGIYIEKQPADTSWYGVCRAASAQTRSTALGATSTNWAKLRLRRIDASTIGFSLDGGTEYTVTANIPTVQLNAGNVITNNAAAEAKTMDIDLFVLRISGLSR